MPNVLAPPARSRSAALVAALLALLALVAGTVAGTPGTARAASSGVLIPGTSWLQGHGVDVVGNGGDSSTYFQCVELPRMRLYPALGWPEVAPAGNGGAAYIPEGSPGLLRYNPGSGYIPVPGDLMIENPHGSNPYGHVAVVDHVSGNDIWAVEQNGSSSGWHRYTYDDSRYGRGYGTVKAVLHAPQNHFTNPSPAAGQDPVQARHALVRYVATSSTGTERRSLTGAPGAAYASEVVLGTLAPVNPGGGRALYSCLAGVDGFTSSDAHCEGRKVVGVLGYAYAAPPPLVTSRALYRCHARLGGDRFDSTDPACEGQLVDGRLGYLPAYAPLLRGTSGGARADALLGYLPLTAPSGGRSLGVLGYAYATRPAAVASRAVYRCISIEAPGKPFDSADAGCEGQGPGTLLGYALATVGVPAATAVSGRAVTLRARASLLHIAVGSTATCVGSFSGATSVVYAWARDGVAIRHQRGATYRVAAADAGHTFVCTAVGAGTGGSATSTSARVAVPVPPRLRAVSAPAVRGTAKPGAVLRATAGTWTPAPTAYRFQWLRDGRPVSRGTAATYRVASTDRGHSLSARVTASRAGATSGAATSRGVRVG